MTGSPSSFSLVASQGESVYEDALSSNSDRSGTHSSPKTSGLNGLKLHEYCDQRIAALLEEQCRELTESILEKEITKRIVKLLEGPLGKKTMKNLLQQLGYPPGESDVLEEPSADERSGVEETPHVTAQLNCSRVRRERLQSPLVEKEQGILEPLEFLRSNNPVATTVPITNEPPISSTKSRKQNKQKKGKRELEEEVPQEKNLGVTSLCPFPQPLEGDGKSKSSIDKVTTVLPSIERRTTATRPAESEITIATPTKFQSTEAKSTEPQSTTTRPKKPQPQVAKITASKTAEQSQTTGAKASEPKVIPAKPIEPQAAVTRPAPSQTQKSAEEEAIPSKSIKCKVSPRSQTGPEKPAKPKALAAEPTNQRNTAALIGDSANVSQNQYSNNGMEIYGVDDFSSYDGGGDISDVSLDDGGK